MLTRHRLELVIQLLAFAALAGCASTPSTPILASQAPTRPPTSIVNPELAKYFQGLNGAFVLYDRNGNQYTRYNPEQCAQRFLPASTFKILNSMIALETGVITDENQVIKWDGTRYDIPAWNQDHTLKSAIQNSVVWFYQELARRVGKEKMQQYVTAAGYGNQDISGSIDTFWLEGGLRISADEQVEFLKRFYSRELPFSERSMNITQEILVLDQTDTYRLSGKTGAVQRVAPNIGWFVGYLETKGNVYWFATNLNGGADANGVKAQEITRDILQGLGLYE